MDKQSAIGAKLATTTAKNMATTKPARKNNFPCRRRSGYTGLRRSPPCLNGTQKISQLNSPVHLAQMKPELEPLQQESIRQ